MECYSTSYKYNLSFSSDFLAIFIIFQTRITIIGWAVPAKMRVSLHSVNSPLIHRVFNFSKNHRRGYQDFPVKMEGISIEGGQKHCFLLMMYRFCSNNALYSAILSFTMFIFLWNPFDTWELHYFESNINLVWHIKVLLMKKEYRFVVSERWRNNFPSWVCFCVYPKFHLGDIVLKNNFKGWSS